MAGYGLKFGRRHRRGDAPPVVHKKSLPVLSILHLTGRLLRDDGLVYLISEKIIFGLSAFTFSANSFMFSSPTAFSVFVEDIERH